MKTQKKPKQDFFAQYHSRSEKYWGVSVALALMLALSIVSLVQNPQYMSSMMASVAQIGKQDIQYPADLVLAQSGNTVTLTLGTQAEAVDTIEGILLVNPEQNIHLSGEHLEALDTGMYRFSLPNSGNSVKKGSIIARFEKDSPNTLQISMTDTQFTSGTHRYNLSNIVE